MENNMNIGRAVFESLALQVQAARADLVDHCEGYGIFHGQDRGSLADRRACLAALVDRWQGDRAVYLARILTQRVAAYEAARVACLGLRG